jgi:hypothetical protein
MCGRNTCHNMVFRKRLRPGDQSFHHSFVNSFTMSAVNSQFIHLSTQRIICLVLGFGYGSLSFTLRFGPLTRKQVKD